MTYATTSYTFFLLDNTIYWLLIANVLFWNYNETYTHELHGNYNACKFVSINLSFFFRNLLFILVVDGRF